MYCYNCGQPLSGDGNFCSTCGADQRLRKSGNIHPKYCYNCGKPLPDGANFCHGCGANQFQESGAASGGSVPQARKVPSNTLFLAVAAVLIVGLIGFFLTQNSGSSKEDSLAVAESAAVETTNAAEVQSASEAPVSEATAAPTQPSVAAATEAADTALDLRVGMTYILGQYEQDGNTRNGQEDIEWLVLKVDRAENKALLISKMGLDSQPYSKTKTAVTWDNCSLRQWLNETFYYDAFTQEDQTWILETEVTPDENEKDLNCDQGSSTWDYVFLLSMVEYEEYLYGNGNIDEDERKGRPTAYAAENDLDCVGEYDYCWWLLRTSASKNEHICSVTAYGARDFSSHTITSKTGLIRPAIWIALE